MLNTITLLVNAVAYEHYFSNISNYHCSSALKISKCPGYHTSAQTTNQSK